METIALFLISLYQKNISPYKGFSCSYRLGVNGDSCSHYGRKVIERYGFWIGYKLLQRRFYDCSWYARKMNEGSYKPYRKLKRQGGFVDCDGCDINPNCGDSLEYSCDLLDFISFSNGCSKTTSSTSSSFKEKRDKKNENKNSD